MTIPNIKTATISWNQQGTPVSEEFNDIYFSNQNGLEETRYVFIKGNYFPDRFLNFSRRCCRVAETGFGTGLNFLAFWQSFTLFRKLHSEAPLKQLHYISFERYPLQQSDLVTTHSHWPELAPFARQLQQLWPMPLAGCHRLLLADETIILDLWFGDINTLIPQLDCSYDNQIDAWFLDGFAPAKNPEMWSVTLFNAMARFTRTSGTFSTFTAAGSVRINLQQTGFNVKKIKGFGHKREMITGTLVNRATIQSSEPWYARPAARKTDDIAIIGGGIASAFTALALLRRGAQVTLYCADQHPAKGASGNRQGIIYPLLNGKGDTLENFFNSAFTFACRQYIQLTAQGVIFDHQWCGVSQLAWDEKSRRKIDKIAQAGWSPALAQRLNRQQLSALCGLDTSHGGIYYPAGGWLCPEDLTLALVILAQQQGMTCCYQYELNHLIADEDGWQLTFANSLQQRHSSVILANGHRLTQWPQTQELPLSAIRGQVSHIPTNATLSQLKNVLCYDGYLTPVNPTNQHQCIGASHQREDHSIDFSTLEQQENYHRLLRCLPESYWAKQIDITGNHARCSIRSSVRDHLPLVGAVPDYTATIAQYQNLPDKIKRRETIVCAPVYRDLFIVGALGARGLCSAPLVAEVMAAQLFGEPLPLNADILAALSPNRFWIKKLLKSKPM